MKLYDMTYYSIDEGVLTPERSWIIEANTDEEMLNKCSELSRKITNGIFMSQRIHTIDFADFTEEFVIEELKNL